MKYLSLDIETTCLQAAPEHILQFSMVVEDSSVKGVPTEDLPHFTCFVNPGRISGEPFALAMNAWILEYLSGREKNPPYPIFNTQAMTDGAVNFINTHFGVAKVTVAGKNVAGFDIPFLPKEIKSRFRHKVLDPGTLFVDWATDDQAPNFEECKKRAMLTDTSVKHDAREDAMDVIKLLRVKYA